MNTELFSLEIVKRFFQDTNIPSSPESIPGSSDTEESCIKVDPYINLNKLEELPEDLLQSEFLQNLLTGTFLNTFVLRTYLSLRAISILSRRRHNGL